MRPNPQPKPKKRSVSLAWQLSGNQFLRSLASIFWLDVLLALLFVLGMSIWTERQAIEIAPKLTELSAWETTPLLLPGWQYEYEPKASNGIPIPKFIENELQARGLPIAHGSTRWLSFPDSSSFISWLNSAAYTITTPSQKPGLLLSLTYSWHTPMRIFSVCFAVLMGLQLISLINSLFAVNRLASRTLQPIYELTRTAARTISTEQVRPQPERETLSLDGTIKTLNTITENRLDTRIVIASERQELKGLATAINEMLDRLDAAYHSQLRFVSDASHELRTPIAVIQGYANMLDRWGKEDEKTLQESIDAIKAEAADMQDLVEQLLFLARTDNDSIRLRTSLVDLSALAEEVLMETKMIDETHAYESSIIPELTVYGDAQLIKQAMRIFVDNAIKYTPAGERICIAANRDGENVALSVSDNGIGIPEKDLPFIFDRFFRADQSRARKTGGTGLGLSIAKWIVDRHGGHVELLSRKEIGTRIVLILPYCAEEVDPSADNNPN